MIDLYPVIGMSPGNSYFKDEEVTYLLKTVVERYGKTAILIADIPAVSTYVALGYPQNRARRDKALPQGNNLRNRTLRVAHELGLSDKVRVIDWETEIENNLEYKKTYERILHLYTTNSDFETSANKTTRGVLEHYKKDISDMDLAVRTAVHYLLSELAFLEFAPKYFGVEKVSYVYHKNWQVYEDYIAGKFDGVIKLHMDFILLENPYETYNPIWGLEEQEDEKYRDVLDRIEKTKTLRVGFIQSVPTFMYDKDLNNFSGIFYEIINIISKKYDWKIQWTEETGYGVIAEGLNNDRFDIFGPTVWPTPERLRVATFSKSLFKSPVFTYVRSDNYKSELDLKDNANMRVVIMDNDIMDSIAKEDFPNNRQVMIPQLSSNIACAKFVADGKGDFTFREKYLVEYFNKDSNIKLIAASEKPIRVYENSFMLKKGEARLKEFLDKELDILEQDGTIKSLIKKYTGSEDAFL
ncbi:MAG: tRNA-dependent cyclodipeptide synthase [Patescibacteria group bacterium]